MKSVLVALSCLVLVINPAWGQRNKKKERQLQQELSLDPDPKKQKKDERPQALDVPKEPPQAIAVDSQRLAFHMAPLSGKGLLSQQVRDGLKALLSSARGAPIVKIRGFVAGTGDMRRVQAIVSETFEERRLQLPVFSVVQVGALPLEGAQVALEAITADKRPLAPNGVAFIAAQPATAADVVGPLKSILDSAGIEAASVRRVTCFLNSLQHADAARTQVAGAFPEAVSNYVQLRRDSAGDFVACEAAAMLSAKPTKAAETLGTPPQVIKLGPGKIVLSGSQLAFGREESDLRLAFERLDKALQSAGTDLDKVVFCRLYSLSSSMTQKLEKLRVEYYKDELQPAMMSLIFEGLPSLDASIGLDVIALPK